MIIDVIMPKMGESITDGTILEWYKKVGDSIEKDETLLEIGTDKVDSEIPSPASGIILEILAEPNDVIDVGEVIARINSDRIEQIIEKVDTNKEQSVAKETKKVIIESNSIEKSMSINKDNTTSSKIRSSIFTPVVIKIANENGITISELEKISGTGLNGRITKKDLQTYIIDSDAIKSSSKQEKKVVMHFSEHESSQMSHMRKTIADHMRHSINTSAHVYIMNEVDMTKIVEFVSENEEQFFTKEKFSLTYTPFIISSVSKALSNTPLMNSSIEGDKIIKHKNINMGIAVSIDSGLMVPSIFNCDEKNFLGISRELNLIVNRVREKTISPDELSGSTFTISNFGIFGATIGTPIINQPNVGVLGTGVIKKQPLVIEKEEADVIAIRSIMNLSLGFDHRLIDGAGGANFLAKVKSNLENMILDNLI